ncbi:MAG: hypothetical protein MJA82_05130 [Clostridia bacterium]|nr:hypothetical protein [Clostridia bacterium]
MALICLLWFISPSKLFACMATTLPGRSTSDLDLLATRYYGYDLLLKDYNSGKPAPDDIMKILEKQLEAELEAAAEDIKKQNNKE